MKVVFLSHPISEGTPLFMGEKGVSIVRDKVLGRNSCNTLKLSFPNHTSTHVDLPRHFIDNGPTLSDYPPQSWIFKRVVVLDIEADGTLIMPDSIKIKNDAELLIVRTGYEKKRTSADYWKKYPGVHPDVADHLAKKMPSIRAFGVDLISISSPLHRDLGRASHREFLSRNIMLIEDMKLSSMDFVPSMVIVLPLMIEHGDGAPCSILAME